MTLPPLPDTDWRLHMPAARYEPAWTSSQEGFTADQMRAYATAAVAAERERCAKIVEEYNPGGSYHIRTALAAAIRREQV